MGSTQLIQQNSVSELGARGKFVFFFFSTFWKMCVQNAHLWKSALCDVTEGRDIFAWVVTSPTAVCLGACV